MDKKCDLKNPSIRRTKRNRFRLRRVARENNRPRLSVFRSSRHMYAQIIDDNKGLTLVSASSIEKENRSTCKGWNCEGATFIGSLLAKRALEKGVKEVVFDRGGYVYHGKIKALAEAARGQGLEF